MDQCTSHSTDSISDLCSLNNIELLFYPPHASNQLQVLDLLIFAITKRYLAKANRLESTNIQSEHLINILQSFYQAANPPNIIASFRNSGISVVYEDGILLVRITPETCRSLLVSLDLMLALAEEETSDDMDNEDFIDFLRSNQELYSGWNDSESGFVSE